MSALFASGRAAWAALVDGPEPTLAALACAIAAPASLGAVLAALALWSGL